MKTKHSKLANLEMPSGSHNIIQCTYSTENLKFRGSMKLVLHIPLKAPHHQDTEDVAESKDHTAIFALTAAKE